MSEWLMIGSSPSVLQTLPKFSDFDGTVITCNSGIKLWPNPDYYVCVDMFASHSYHNKAKAAQDQGTKLVTLKRSPSAMKERRIEHYDIFLELSDKPESSRGRFGSFRYTGPLCVEFACHNGAKTIHLVGFDGYRHSTDYFDPDLPRRIPKDMMQTHTLDHIQPKMNDLANVWNDVQFIQYGDPCFTVGEDNWRVERDIMTDLLEAINEPLFKAEEEQIIHGDGKGGTS